MTDRKVAENFGAIRFLERNTISRPSAKLRDRFQNHWEGFPLLQF